MTPTPDPLREALNAVVTKTTWRPDNTVLIHDGTAWNTLVGRIVMATNGDVQPAPALDVDTLPEVGRLTDYQRGYLHGFDAPTNVAARTPTPDPLELAILRCRKPHLMEGPYRDRQRIEDWNDGVESLGREVRKAAKPAPALDVERGYTVIVSSLPALYRSWRDSPNETAALLNRMLIDAAIEWLQSYERATGRPVDEFREYSPSGDPA